MSQLAKLSIACCKLVEVPPGLGKVVSLRFLDLSFNDLNDLPEVSEAGGA
jgi:Leucine-rich repeat (LRR) protein